MNIGMTASENEATCPHELNTSIEIAGCMPRIIAIPTKPDSSKAIPMRIPKNRNARNMMIVMMLTTIGLISFPSLVTYTRPAYSLSKNTNYVKKNKNKMLINM